MYIQRDENRMCQGDILEDVEYQSPKFLEDQIEIDRIILPYAVILTQDCDLKQDYDNRINNTTLVQDKFLQSILICPAYLAEQVRLGEHLQSLNLKREVWKSKQWPLITSNQNQRFHHLPAQSKFNTSDLVIDFKQYYTMPRDICFDIHKEKYLTSLDGLFREDLSQRFAYYLSRIGLPEPEQLVQTQ